MNLVDVLDESARSWPNDPSIIQDDRSLTYSRLLAAVHRVADTLRASGIQPGDKVCVVFPRSIEYIVGCLAVLRVDAVAVPMSAALKQAEMARLAAETDVDAFCYAAPLRDIVPAGDDSRQISVASLTPGGVGIEIKLATAPSRDFAMRQRLKQINAAYICFSSGTTAKSKGIVLSHESLYERAHRRLDAPQVTRESSILWLRAFDRFVPNQIFAALSVGGKAVIGNSLRYDKLPSLIAAHGINQVWAPVPFYRALLREKLPRKALAPIRYFLSSGSSLPADVAEAFHEKFHKHIMQNYGSGECSPIFINSSPDPARCASVGLPVDGREVRLVPPGADTDTDAEEGELLVRGIGMLHAYYKPWREREEIFDHGWFHTGDLARRDGDGYYWIVGRIKETINVGGAKVFPNEIEEILLSHPDVEDAMVFGTPDPRYGEVPHAKVTLRGGGDCAEKDLLLFVNDQLTVSKAVRRIFITNAIEKTATGKSRRW